MNITKEYFLSASSEVARIKEITPEYINCMYEYYLHTYNQKYKGRSKPNNVKEFSTALVSFFRIPVTFGNNPTELLMNKHYQDPNAAIRKTNEYFNKYFGITQ